jgi:hypothetical protein
VKIRAGSVGGVSVEALKVDALNVDALKAGAAPRSIALPERRIESRPVPSSTPAQKPAQNPASNPATRRTNEFPTRNQKAPSSSFEAQLAARLVERMAERGGVDPALRRASTASELSNQVRSNQVRSGQVRPAVFGPFDAPRASEPTRFATAITTAVTTAVTTAMNTAVTTANAALARSKDPLWGEFTSFLVVVALIAVTFFV